MKQELIYKKPECLVIEIEAQSVLCASATDFKDGGDLDLLF